MKRSWMKKKSPKQESVAQEEDEEDKDGEDADVEDADVEEEVRDEISCFPISHAPDLDLHPGVTVLFNGTHACKSR